MPTKGWGIDDNFATGNGTELAAPSQRLINYTSNVHNLGFVKALKS
jgi:hypothetical protein